MSSLTLWNRIITIYIQIICIYAQVQQSVVLNANTPSASGISIAHNFEATQNDSVVNGSWNVHVDTQYGSTFNITMDSSWGFHPTTKSTVTITLNGFTSNNSINADYADLLFLFSVNDNQFFTTYVHLDDQNQ